MRRPQPVLNPITEAAIFLVMTVSDGGEADARDALTEVSALKRSVGFRIPEGELSCVVGIGSGCWDRLFGSPRPARLHPLPTIAGTTHTAVSTPGDLFFHIRAHRFDLCFELAQRLVERLAGSAKVVDEVHGFRSFDERDLLGFVDGTENPDGEDAAQAVLIGGEDERFEGGSYIVVQKYLHDMTRWDALSIEQQERAIGRTKLEDIELADGDKPTNSHVALNTIVDDDGRQHQIVRMNMPFGNVGAGEIGTYFAGYAREPELIELMLRNMFVGKPPGNHDRILHVSTAVTGSLFFVPSAPFLDDPNTTNAPPAGDLRPAGDDLQVPAADDEPAVPREDGSLGLGGLGAGS
jgi:putative iron-dependent peroxidase